MKRTTDLQTLSIQINSVVKRDTTVFIEIKLSIIPNDLALSIQSQLFIVILQKGTVTPIIKIWVSGNSVWVALKYEQFIPSDTAYLILNADVISSIYQSMGYSAANVFISTGFNNSLSPASPSTTVPAGVTSSVADQQDAINPLNTKAIKSVRERN